MKSKKGWSSSGRAVVLAVMDVLAVPGVRAAWGIGYAVVERTAPARLCLARALARKPRILLIDEVTASLDPDTERSISGLIAEYEGTVLISSHRAETLGRTTRVLRLAGSAG